MNISWGVAIDLVLRGFTSVFVNHSEAPLRRPGFYAVRPSRFPKPEEFEPRGLVVRQLEHRWGSMTPRGKLILNRSLIRSSVDAIDYVITHELCHLRHNHHGSEFFGLLDRVMPDWRKRKIKLELQLA